jgi:Fe-S-cluster containining protein
MREIEQLKEEILKDYPRMGKDDTFTFHCHPGVSCFNECCGDVNIFLTPYDVIRLKNALGISSQEFLDKYTLMPFDKNLGYPVILLQMEENEKKSCPFVGAEGCEVYQDRPWACRMYPLGLASPKEGSEELQNEFYFLLKETICKGFGESRKQTVGEWIEDQGIEEYNRMGEEFKELTLHPVFQSENALSPQKIEMFFMVCYNIDVFRKFVFGSSFLKKFDVDAFTQMKMKEDDVELLKFGFRWLRFALFGEPTISINTEVKADKEQELRMKQKLT